MFAKRSVRAGGPVLWKGALGAFLLAVGPCANLQSPPANTELFWGIAIATGAEISAAAAAARDEAVLPSREASLLGGHQIAPAQQPHGPAGERQGDVRADGEDDGPRPPRRPISD
ncbi:MAG: hypothetical protein ACYSUQ_10340 [Planctomycetota bacterium]|jgi:hypothetical protein